MMRCLRCGNVDKDLFIYFNNKWICRKCLVYKENKKIKEIINRGDGNFSLPYDLTGEQKNASEFVLNNIKAKKDCTLQAVTGSGKTEVFLTAAEKVLEKLM